MGCGQMKDETTRPSIRSSDPTMQPNQNSNKMHFKVLIVGDSSVGKSALLLRFTEDQFTPLFTSTIGVDFKVKKVTMRETTDVKLSIWDTAGQERFRTIVASYYRGCDGVLLVYDIRDTVSFQSVERWYAEIGRYSYGNPSVVLVGTKCDQEDQRQVPMHEAQALALEMGIPWIETSSLTGHNVDEAFGLLVDSMVRKRTMQKDKAM